MRKVSWILVALAALATALVIVATILGLSLFPTRASTTLQSTFRLPAELPTASVNASNPHGCGANRSDFLSLPAHSFLTYYVTVNESGAQVLYWVLGPGASPGSNIVSYGNESRGHIELGAAAATLQFVFQGCSSAPTVPLGFWGNFTWPRGSS